MAVASLGRREHFNAAIIGNSHVAPISPERLSQTTGLNFVSLTLAGASVEPKLKVLNWFLVNRSTPPKLIVIGVDDVWCRAVPVYAEEPPLPTWLISDSAIAYAVNMFRFNSLEHALQRIFSPSTTSVRPPHPRGYWDLELDYKWEERIVAEQLSRPWAGTVNVAGRFPAIAMLEKALTSAPPDTAIALIMLPVWAGILPLSGPENQTAQACSAAFNNFSRSRRNGIFIDARKRNSRTEDAANFFDRTHFRDPIARQIEFELAKKFELLSKENATSRSDTFGQANRSSRFD